MPYHVCSLDQPYFSINREFFILKEHCSFKNTTDYNLTYLIQKYEPLPLSYPQWIAKREFINGSESIVQLGSFHQYFSTCFFKYFNHFKQIQVIGETKESSLKIKALIKSVFPALHFPNSLNSVMENQTVDVVHTIISQERERGIREQMLPEILRILKNQGVYYLTAIVQDYDGAIHELCKEFEPAYLTKGDEQINFEEAKLYLSKHFASLEVDEFTSELQITDVEDLIVYILSDPKYIQLKLCIAKSGLSSFRRFLESKMAVGRTTILKRHIKLLICRKNK